MNKHDKRAQDLLELIIAASCEAKYLRFHGRINSRIEMELDDAAGLLKVDTASIAQEHKDKPSFLKKFGFR
jgi:hypothetical protein